MEDKEVRRRKWQQKRINDIGGERRFRTKKIDPKVIKEERRRPTKKELLNDAFNPDLPSDTNSWG